MERRQEFMREFLIEEGHEPLEFVGMAAAKGEPTVVADLMRRALGLPPDWSRINPTWTRALSYLREASESAGVLVVINGIVGNNTRRKLDPEEFRGFALVDPYAPLVFVNGADAKAAQIFSLAHELAHIVTGEPGVSGLPNLRPTDHKVEVFCNAVAAEFLVPAALMETVWDSARENERPFEVVARHFKVSALVAARRAYDLGYISHEEYSIVFNREVSEERKKKPGGGDFWVNQNQRVGRRFGRALVQAAREGRLLYQSAYELSGLFGGTFEKYADRVAPREAR
jgi:Zn-dependent peptidase ImmA (M78 family)